MRDPAGERIAIFLKLDLQLPVQVASLNIAWLAQVARAFLEMQWLKVSPDYQPEQDPALSQETGGPGPGYHLYRASMETFFRDQLAAIQRELDDTIKEAAGHELKKVEHCSGSKEANHAAQKQSRLVSLG